MPSRHLAGFAASHLHRYPPRSRTARTHRQGRQGDRHPWRRNRYGRLARRRCIPCAAATGTALFHKDFDGTNNRVTNLAYATRGKSRLPPSPITTCRASGTRTLDSRTPMYSVFARSMASGARAQIAAEYGIARGTVYQIQSWRVRGTSGVAGRDSTLGARIRQVRRQHTLSAAAMAKELGVTPSAVTAWERGEKTPRYPARIAALLAQVEAARMPSHTDGEEAVRTDTPAPPPRIRRSVLPVSRDSHATESMWHVTTE